MEKKDFLSSLLDKGDSELLALFFQEYELSRKQMMQVLVSPHVELYVNVIRELASVENLPKASANKAVKQGKGSVVASAVEDDKEKAKNASECDGDAALIAEIPEIYFQELRKNAVFNLEDRRVSQSVRTSLSKDLNIFTKNQIFVVGQLVELGFLGVKEILQSKENAEVLCRNLKRVCNVEIGEPSPSLHVALSSVVERYCKEQKNDNLKQEQEDKKLHENMLLSRSIEEVDFFNQTGEVYKSLSKNMRSHISKLRNELLNEGYKKLRDVVALDEEVFLLAFRPSRLMALKTCLQRSGIGAL